MTFVGITSIWRSPGKGTADRFVIAQLESQCPRRRARFSPGFTYDRRGPGDRVLDLGLAFLSLQTCWSVIDLLVPSWPFDNPSVSDPGLLDRATHWAMRAPPIPNRVGAARWAHCRRRRRRSSPRSTAADRSGITAMVTDPPVRSDRRDQAVFSRIGPGQSFRRHVGYEQGIGRDDWPNPSSATDNPTRPAAWLATSPPGRAD
jgi:hypothetical protein